MRRSSTLGLSLLILAVCSFAFAERPPQERGEASHVVVGHVERIFTDEGRSEIGYIVAIRIESVERGDGWKPEQLFYAYCFQRKRSAPRVPAAYGHKHVPKVGQRIRAFVHHANGEMEGNYSDWFDVLKSK